MRFPNKPIVMTSIRYSDTMYLKSVVVNKRDTFVIIQTNLYVSIRSPLKKDYNIITERLVEISHIIIKFKYKLLINTKTADIQIITKPCTPLNYQYGEWRLS